MMVSKIVVVLLLFAILYSLGSGLIYLVRKDQSGKVVKALTWRVALSLVLFGILILSYWMGWIQPHGL